MKKRKLTRKQIRALSMQGVLDRETTNLTAKFSQRRIQPKTNNQSKVFDAYYEGQNLFLYGYAGTGKTFLSMHLALEEVLNNYYNKLVIVRSVVPTRDMGFLPGKEQDKTKVYEQPYQQICADLFQRGDAYDILKNKQCVEFMATSFIRGITLHDSIVLIDECQNMSDHELNSIITRLGDNSKLIICGDFRQSDLQKERSGFHQTMKIFRKMKSMSLIEFNISDIVRSGFVKDYIIAREQLKDEKFYNRPNFFPETETRYDRWSETLRTGGGRYSNSLPISNDSFSQAVKGSYQTMA